MAVGRPLSSRTLLASAAGRGDYRARLELIKWDLRHLGSVRFGWDEKVREIEGRLREFITHYETRAVAIPEYLVGEACFLLWTHSAFRHLSFDTRRRFFEKAFALGNGSALVEVAKNHYKERLFKMALSLFAKALLGVVPPTPERIDLALSCLRDKVNSSDLSLKAQASAILFVVYHQASFFANSRLMRQMANVLFSLEVFDDLCVYYDSQEFPIRPNTFLAACNKLSAEEQAAHRGLQGLKLKEALQLRVDGVALLCLSHLRPEDFKTSKDLLQIMGLLSRYARRGMLEMYEDAHACRFPREEVAVAIRHSRAAQRYYSRIVPGMDVALTLDALRAYQGVPRVRQDKRQLVQELIEVLEGEETLNSELLLRLRAYQGPGKMMAFQHRFRDLCRSYHLFDLAAPYPPGAAFISFEKPIQPFTPPSSLPVARFPEGRLRAGHPSPARRLIPSLRTAETPSAVTAWASRTMPPSMRRLGTESALFSRRAVSGVVGSAPDDVEYKRVGP